MPDEKTQLATLETLPQVPRAVEVAPDCVQMCMVAAQRANAITCIASQADYETAELSLKEVTKLSNHIDKQRLAYVAPLTNLAKLAKTNADRVRAPLEKAKETLKKIMADYLLAERRRQEEALAAAAAEQERREREAREAAEKAKSNVFAVALGDVPNVPVVPPVPITLEVSKPVETKGSAIMEKWLWSVEDESQIPREFYTLDTKKLDALVREHKGSLTIPGIKVFSEIGVRSR